MDFIKTPTKGMRDLLPNDMELREYVLSLMNDVYQKFGFELIQTPVVEHIENLTSKQGGENEKLIFKILKRGEKLKQGNVIDVINEDFDTFVDSGLRYDLTVPLARFYANNNSSLATPFRAFQKGNVYRAERSQKGRFREFMQCDLDILGEKTNLAEIELICAVTEFLKALHFENFTIRLNDRRILMKMAEYVKFPLKDIDSVLISLDKLDKIGKDGVKEELLSLGFLESQIDEYLQLVMQDTSSLEEYCKTFHMEEDVVNNLKEIMLATQNITSAHLVFDPTLVRGMGYYTGPIFEISVEDLPFAIGGGGRYDHMIEKFAHFSVPACGFSVGFERLLLLLEERGFTIPKKDEKVAYIFSSDEKKNEVLKIANQEREKNKIVKVLYRSKNFKFQKESLEKEGYQVLEY